MINVAEKVVMVGSAQVGKTSILRALTQKPFESSYRATIGVDFEVFQLDVKQAFANGAQVQTSSRFQLWDLAGQERFRTTTLQTYSNSKQVLLVFDVNNHESFVALSAVLAEVLRCACEVDLILVGNQIDTETTNRQVSEESARAFAEENDMTYFGVSAKTGENLEALKMCLISNAAKRPKPERRPIAEGPRSIARYTQRLSPSYSKQLLAATGLGLLGGVLSQYKAPLFALLAGAHISPMMLVGLALVAAVALGYGAHRMYANNHRPLMFKPSFDNEISTQGCLERLRNCF